MFLYELSKKQTMGEEAFPVLGLHTKLTVELDFGDIDVPPAARRRIAFQALKQAIEDSFEDELLPVGSHEPILTGEERHGDGWAKPNGLDLRVVKSAHRVILEVAKRGESGKAVLASELVGAMGLSAPTVGRLLRDGDAGNEYIKPFIMMTPNGRTKAIDLTPAGRLLASKIRAGSVPV